MIFVYNYNKVHSKSKCAGFAKKYPINFNQKIGTQKKFVLVEHVFSIVFVFRDIHEVAFDLSSLTFHNNLYKMSMFLGLRRIMNAYTK